MTSCASDCCAFASCCYCACGLASSLDGGCFASFDGGCFVSLMAMATVTAKVTAMVNFVSLMAMATAKVTAMVNCVSLMAMLNCTVEEVQGLAVGLGMSAAVRMEEELRPSTIHISKDSQDPLDHKVDDTDLHSPSRCYTLLGMARKLCNSRMSSYTCWRLHPARIPSNIDCLWLSHTCPCPTRPYSPLSIPMDRLNK